MTQSSTSSFSSSASGSGSGGGASRSSGNPDRARMLQESRAVKSYLRFLNQTPEDRAAAQQSEQQERKTRKVSPAALQKQLARLDTQIKSADVLKRLSLQQKRIEVQGRLAEAIKESEKQASSGGMSDKERMEADFIKHASAYGERQEISYQAWRALKVPAAVLRRAGVYRAS